MRRILWGHRQWGIYYLLYRMYYLTIIISFLGTFAKIIKWWTFCQIVGYPNLSYQLAHRRSNSTQWDRTLIPFRTGFFGWYDKWFVSRKTCKIYHKRRKAERISSEDKKNCTVWSGTTRKICRVREQNTKYGMIKNLGEGEVKAMDNEGLVSCQVAWVSGWQQLGSLMNSKQGPLYDHLEVTDLLQSISPDLADIHWWRQMRCSQKGVVSSKMGSGMQGGSGDWR